MDYKNQEIQFIKSCPYLLPCGICDKTGETPCVQYGVQKLEQEYVGVEKTKDDVVRVGDVVSVTCYGNGIVTRICNNTFAITWADGTNGVVHEDAATKTGKSFPKMVDILEALK